MVVVLIAADALSAPHVQTIQDALGADNPPPAAGRGGGSQQPQVVDLICAMAAADINQSSATQRIDAAAHIALRHLPGSN